MLATLLIVAGLLQVITAAATTPSAQCYEKARDYYPYLSTRTAYETVHGHVSRLESSCKPVQIWMLARHGTRYPGVNEIPRMLNLTSLQDEILRNHEKGAGLLCSADLERLRDWRADPNLKVENGEKLTEQGEKDLRQLAERLKGTFYELLDARTARPGDFVFRATNTQRTQASMEAFARGLFQNDRSLTRSEKAPVNDTLLAGYDKCPAWKSGYELERVDAERDKFTAGPEMQAVLWDVGHRLGFNRALDFGTVKIMYDMCRFETAWYPHRTSTWCLVFRRNELKVFEYREDLDYYYFAGPGRSMSAKIGCQGLSDMFEHFKALESGNFTNQPKGVFYFGHTVTLHTLMSALGVNEEPKPLLANNYAELQKRHFRTSLFGPFATNVVAVFYRCLGSTIPNRVTIYTAEKLDAIPGCSDGVCDWNILEQKFAPQVEKCSRDFCFEKAPASAATLTENWNLIVLMIVALSARFILT